ncbi:hypothetical protein BDQ17DRAFT_1254088 [Cyathus striatus]|nr:hypothetical protein BDQ17DRAFT_1254088 [Cyathus striatus]
MKFSYHVAIESSASSPCSNVPMSCPVCPKEDSAIWKYSMKQHFEDKYKSLNISSYSHH